MLDNATLGLLTKLKVLAKSEGVNIDLIQMSEDNGYAALTLMNQFGMIRAPLRRSGRRARRIATSAGCARFLATCTPSFTAYFNFSSTPLQNCMRASTAVQAAASASRKRVSSPAHSSFSNCIEMGP